MKRLFLHFFFISLIATSCNSFRYIDIQILVPSENKPPQKIEQLFIIQSLQFNKMPRNGIDSNLFKNYTNKLFHALDSTLFLSPLFANTKIQVVFPAEYKNYYASSNFESRKRTFVIALDSIAIKDSIFSDQLFTNLYNGDVNLQLFGICEIMYAAKFRLKNAVFENKNQTIELADTMRWEYPLDFNNLDLLKKNKHFNYKELADLMAADVAKKIAPFWKTTERKIYYSANKYMRQAYKSFSDNNTEIAINQWTKVYNLGTKSIASKAAFNIALSYEIEDNLNGSKNWLNKALVLKNDSTFHEYQRVIDQRIQEKDKIDKQLGN